MCGRVVSSSSVSQLVDWLRVDEVVGPELPPSWNVAPGREVYAVADTRAGTRRLGVMRWGLVPSWSKDPSSGPRPINARAESLLERPAFADAVAHRRCLVPVDGFYEWGKLPSGGRQPWFIDIGGDGAPEGGGHSGRPNGGPERDAPPEPARMEAPGGRRNGTEALGKRATSRQEAGEERGPLVLAGLWDRWVSPDGETLVTVAIVTVPANADVARLHDRMPAVLPDPEAWDRWLDPATVDPELVTPLLAPVAPGFLRLRPVDPRVNNVAHDGPDLLTEVEEPARLF